MTTTTFSPNPWGTLRNATSAAALRGLAVTASEEQLILLHQRLAAAATELVDERGLARDIAVWIVTQGKRSWWTVLTKAAKVPAELPANAWSALQVIEDVYRERFGREIPPMEPPPVGAHVYDPAWEPAFWDVMDIMSVGVPIDEAVIKFTRSELERLHAVANVVAERVEAYVDEHWGEEPTDSGWTYWAGWMPLLGSEVYQRMMGGGRDVPIVVPPDSPVVYELLEDEYRRRYGERIAR